MSSNPRPVRPRHRRWWVLTLVALFVLVPIVEIYVLIQVGQVIGVWWTILLLIADSVFGSWLIKHEGARAWEALRVALASGRMPTKELADGALILIGGTLMLSPGFVTDVFGIVMILPFTRPLARRLLTAMVGQRVMSSAIGAATSTTARRPGAGVRADGGGPVVQGEVVED